MIDNMEILQNNIILLALTFGIYYAARQLQKWTGWFVLNPILVTIVALIGLLKLTDISYETYSEAGGYIEFWLKPAIVALGVPLYQHLGQIRRQFLPIFLSQLAGCIVGLVSVVLIAQMMGASRETIISLAPKSVTTPIAMEVCQAMGGIPSLTAAIVVTVGLFGAVFGFIQGFGGVAHQESVLPRSEYRHGLPCRRHIACDGERRYLRHLCLAGTNLERLAYSSVCALCIANNWHIINR